MKRSLEELIEYVKTTRRNGKYLSEDPLVRQKIAKLYTDMEAGRAHSYKIAWMQEKGNLIFSPAAASESKVFSLRAVSNVWPISPSRSWDPTAMWNIPSGRLWEAP